MALIYVKVVSIMRLLGKKISIFAVVSIAPILGVVKKKFS